MENKTEILKKMGYDITPIIEGLKNPVLISYLTSGRNNGDLVIEEMSEEEVVLFSNKIYDIIMKFNEG